jgi:GNAT superfamily N-acetyltransferase
MIPGQKRVIESLQTAIRMGAIKPRDGFADKDLRTWADGNDSALGFFFIYTDDVQGWISKKVRITVMATYRCQSTFRDKMCFEISLFVLPELRGRGLAQRILRSSLLVLHDGIRKRTDAPYYLWFAPKLTDGAGLAIGSKLAWDEVSEVRHTDGETYRICHKLCS